MRRGGKGGDTQRIVACHYISGHITYNNTVKPETRDVIVKSSVGLVCVAMIALCGMYMYEINMAVYYSAIALFAIAGVVYCAVDGSKFPHASRTVLVATIILTVAAAVYLLYYLTGLNVRFGNFDALKAFIVDSGFWGFAVFIGLVIVQVILLPIPAAVIILLGVAIYGATVSFILTTIGTLIGSLVAFTLGKVFGRRLCNWMFGNENTDKYARLLGEKGRFILIIMLLFPAFPDDMLCMIAGITDMSYGYFTVICVLTRPVMIGFTAYLGSGIIPFSGWGIPVWVALVCVLFVSFIIITRLKARFESGRMDRSAKDRHLSKNA